MAKSGPHFYDEPGVFGWYRAKRSRADNPNDTLEKPVFNELAGNLRALRIPLMLFLPRAVRQGLRYTSPAALPVLPPK